jgi:hypothetical protein
VRKRALAQTELRHAAESLQLIQPGRYDIQPYGSCRSGLLFPDSDLDLALTGTCIRQQDGVEVPLFELSREEQVRLLKALAKKISKQYLAQGMVRKAATCDTQDHILASGTGLFNSLFGYR